MEEEVREHVIKRFLSITGIVINVRVIFRLYWGRGSAERGWRLQQQSRVIRVRGLVVELLGLVVKLKIEVISVTRAITVIRTARDYGECLLSYKMSICKDRGKHHYVVVMAWSNVWTARLE